jgi:hypothetical protein
MNYATESFNDFASKLSPTDLALYAGAALVLFVLFRDKMGPAQKIIENLVNKAKALLGKSSSIVSEIKVPSVTNITSVSDTNTEDTFFKLIVSWKQTRDLANKLNCADAVKVADQMFPYLSPNACKEKPSL